MTTTKTDLMRKFEIRDIKREKNFRRTMATHIPDLWAYAKRLQTNEEKAYALLADTIKSAGLLFDQEANMTPDYTTLSRLMYVQFLKTHAENENMPKPVIFSKPVRGNFIALHKGRIAASPQTLH